MANPFFYFINGLRHSMIGFTEAPEALGVARDSGAGRHYGVDRVAALCDRLRIAGIATWSRAMHHATRRRPSSAQAIIIGSAIARRFAAEGYTIFAGRRTADKLAPLEDTPSKPEAGAALRAGSTPARKKTSRRS